MQLSTTVKEATGTVTVALPASDLDKLKIIAAVEGVTIDEIIRRAVSALTLPE